MDRLEQQFQFIKEIDKEKMIGRQTYLSDAKRKENDAEHAWHMAIMTVLLSEYANDHSYDEYYMLTLSQAQNKYSDSLLNKLDEIINQCE